MFITYLKDFFPLTYVTIAPNLTDMKTIQ